MNVSSIYGYNPTLSLINALYPTSSVSSLFGVSGTSGVSSLLSMGGVQTSISSVGNLLNGVETLESAAQSLAGLGKFDARTVTSANAKIATASVGAGTASGTYAVEVRQLAQAQTLSSAPQTSSLTPIGSGAASLTFQFASGETRQVALGSASNTLAGIASAINSADIGLRAQVVSSSAGYQLSVTGQSGAANAFTVGVSGNAGMADLLTYPAQGSSGVTLTSQAQNAEGLLNGTAFTASTNTVGTATPGLTLNLVATGKTALSVAPDSAMTKTVSSFVDAYNAVQTTLTGLGSENTSLGLSVSYLRSQLSNALGDSTSLARIGITGNANGTLSLNAPAFNAAVSASPASVAGVLSSSSTGLAGRVAALTDGALSASRLLQVAVPSFNSSSLLGTSGQSWEYSYLGQLGVLDTANTSSGLSSLFLNEMLGSSASSTANGSASNQFLQSLLAQQAYNANLLSATVG
ncbi:flagellar filament capping protein FliD [Dechloromonas denitrificans]|uniref:flagellar filament capping protein FliD n=1 Tax=Dechloromonas denitrificans TaxID=281362 RepID=UPI001CF8BFEA|nr:flagellar filament capping protein FliD [Dechloromonas denitrificans]UCV01970.1 flagellar filament capping protein FliD [Dechloromonas denitrificans]